MKESLEKEWLMLSQVMYRSPRLRRLLAGSDPGISPGSVLRRPEARDIFAADFPEWADSEMARCREAGVALVTYGQADFPPRLRDLPDPPPLLYIRGTLPANDGAAVAIVGSRRASLYGLRVAELLGRESARAGLTVVSGLARGVDAAAHRGALEAGGRTVGVLGCGVDRVYPSENQRVYEAVASAGALVSEFPLGAAPRPENFPVRNRIIAAMSDGVVVVEAARDSGSLITASLAGDTLGLPVGAVPGPITSRTSEGCNDLIYDGATPIRDVRDLVEMVAGACRGAGRAVAPEPAGDGLFDSIDPEARRTFESLSPEEERGVDELSDMLGLATGTLLGHLLDLELRGLAVRRPGGRYISKG